MAFQRLVEAGNDCFSKRNLNYMCEISRSQSAWTLENGLCWPDKDYDDLRYPQWNIINLSNLTNQEKCQYLFRCLLSNNFEHDCPCNHLNCTKMILNVCPNPDQLIVYPPDGLINANILIFYNYSTYERNINSYSFFLHHSLKCRGYLGQMKSDLEMEKIVSRAMIITNPLMNQLVCFLTDPDTVYQDLTSRLQYDEFCWNESLTFNGRPYAVNPDLCVDTGQCISQYRIHDGPQDCPSGHDEIIVLEKSLCTGNVGRHRFQCYNNQHKCLTMEELGTKVSQCSNNYDESWYGNSLSLRQDLLCQTGVTTDCDRLKDYVQQSSAQNSSRNYSLDHSQTKDQTDRIAFRSYCDSFWDSDTHWDELPFSCQYWICPSDQYQCQTGQCIRLNWLCDGEWDCTDASDEEAIFLIRQWSPHNARLSNFSLHLDKCREKYFRTRTPFSNICNVSFEFGCYRSEVSNPLDIRSSRPCINLTQIGDGKEDCYNAYDEKNTFPAESTVGDMWGFHFRCGIHHKTYLQACHQSKTNNCTDFLCSVYRDKDGSCSAEKDFFCLEDNQCKKGVRCNGNFECFHGEDEYWCPSGSFQNQERYRYDKLPIIQRQNLDIELIKYPEESLMMTTEKQVSKLVIDLRNDQFFQNHSYLCNRGISVIQMDDVRCLCPPSYYGSRCQFFSDRLSIIAHLDRKTFPMSMANTTLKIQTNFLFNDMIIDQQEFYLIPTIEAAKSIKHKFYLLYSRFNSMLQHKRNRYFNRTDIITNHPYAVHFLIFALHQNNRPEELGIWHYPIYFDYLPSFRLAIVLKFPFWFGNSSLNSCQSNICSKYSICVPIFNQNNSFYCSCQSGYYGVNCSIYEPLCDTYCAAKAFCQPNKERKPHCICPLGYFGARCHLKYEQCDDNACQNNGTCYPSYDQSGEEPFICSCSNSFYGSRCQNEKASVRVQLNMTIVFSPRAVVVQLYRILPPSLTLQIKYQKVHEGLPSIITSFHTDDRAPHLGILKIYEDFQNPQYFVMYILDQSLINITSSPQHCSHVSAFLPKGQFHFHTNIFTSS
jgi:hypothetical protein